jgi:hypothetical protein
MTYLLWRQHRNQFLFAFAALAALAAVLVPTGLHTAHAYSTAVNTCAATDSCSHLDEVFRNFKPLVVVMGMTGAVPALFGLFWGAPLVAREVEQGTHQFVWTQAVTRRHWLAVKLGWLLLAAAAWGAAIAGLVSWWSRPENSLYEYRFQLGHFDTQGIVPIGYCVFAVALGVAVGALIRRVLPALAVTLGVFTGMRFLIDYVARQHYQTPLSASTPLGHNAPVAPGSFWSLSQTTIDPAGHPLSRLRLAIDTLPADCRNLVTRGLPGPGQLVSCLGDHGYRTVTTYQPANRFWLFQGIETAIYVGLAAACVALTFYLLHRRDA